MNIPLEDNFSDVIGKAQRGLEISDSDLAEKARLDANTIRKLRSGHFDELALFRVAPVLGLGARERVRAAQNPHIGRGHTQNPDTLRPLVLPAARKKKKTKQDN